MRRAWIVVAAAALVFGGCQRKSQSSGSSGPPPGQYQGQYQGGYPPGQYQGGYPPGQVPPGQPPPQPGAPPVAQPPLQPPVQPVPATPPPVVGGVDPINAVNIGWMRQRSSQVLAELVAALPANRQTLVQNIPLVPDPTVGEVNAFAACTKQGQSLMAISDGLMDIQSHMAQYAAVDEIYGTRKLDEYIQFIAQNQQPGAPIVQPPQTFITAAQANDPNKIARQHQIFDEQLAFVLGHELGHHYLGHTGCVGGGPGPISVSDVNNVLSNAIPVFNQPNEISSDVEGTNNLLAAGQRQSGYRWTEGGALLTLHFFAQLDQLTPATVVFGFERTHPHPLIRRPIVQQTAATFKAGGGALPQLPIPWPF